MPDRPSFRIAVNVLTADAFFVALSRRRLGAALPRSGRARPFKHARILHGL